MGRASSAGMGIDDEKRPFVCQRGTNPYKIGSSTIPVTQWKNKHNFWTQLLDERIAPLHLVGSSAFCCLTDKDE
jgi:hypothetical protein